MERNVELRCVQGGQSRSTRGPSPADDDGWPRALNGLGKGRRINHLIVRTGVAERRIGGRRPQTGDDGQLLFQPVKALPQLRKRNAIGLMLGTKPSRSQTELHPTPTHLIHLGHGNGEWSGQSEGGRRHQSAKPDGGRVSGQSGQGDPRIGGARQAADGTHLQIVVGAEECRKALLLSAAGNSQQIVVGGALLGFGEDSQFHGGDLTDPIDRPGSRAVHPRMPFRR